MSVFKLLLAVWLGLSLASCEVAGELGINDGQVTSSSIQFLGARQAELSKSGKLVIRWDAPAGLRGIDTSEVRYEVYLHELKGEEAVAFEANLANTMAETTEVSKPKILNLPEDQLPVQNGSPIATVEGIRFYEYAGDQKSDTVYLFQIRSLGIKDRSDENTAVVVYKAGFQNLNDFIGIESITSEFHGRVEISWSTSTDEAVQGYNIYSGTSFTNLVASVPNDSNRYSFEELSAGSQVTYGVRAFNTFGLEDDNTRTQSIEVLNNKVPDFLGLSTLRSDQDSITLYWQPADGNPSVYNIYHGTTTTGLGIADLDSINLFEPTVQVDSLLTNYTLSGLADDTEHHFVVRAAVKGGAEDQNSMVKLITLPDLGAPKFDGIGEVSAVSGAIQVSWGKALGQTSSYKVYASTQLPLDFTVANLKATVPATEASTTIASLAENQTWYLGVKATDQHNQVDVNTFSKAFTVGDQTPPLFLGYSGAGLIAVNGYEDRLSLSFRSSAEADVNSYLIYTKKSTDASYVLYDTVGVNPNSVITETLTGLTGNTDYSVQVKVKDTAGNISTSNATVTARTLDLTPPTFGGIVSVTRDSENAPLLAQANWSAPLSSDTASFHLFYSKSSMIGKSFSSSSSFPLGVGDDAIAKLDIASPSALSATRTILNHLDENTTYYFIVRAKDSSGNEDTNFGQVSFAVPTVSPPDFAGVATAIVPAETVDIDLTWSEPTSDNPAAQYYIYATTDTTNPRQWGVPTIVNAPRTSYQLIENANTNAPFGELEDVYIKINARNVEGILDENNTERVVTIPDITGPVFGGLTSTVIDGDSESISLRFTAATDAQSIKDYRVYWRTYPSGVFASSPNLVVSHNTACPAASCAIDVGADEGLVAGTNYEFKIDVSDVNVPENVSYSDSKLTQSFPNFLPPPAPTGVGKSPDPGSTTNIRNYTVSGQGTDGKIVRIYCRDTTNSITLDLATCGASQALSGTTSFSVPLTLPDLSGSYQIFVVQYDSSNGKESAPLNAGSLVALDREASYLQAFTGCATGFCQDRSAMGVSSASISSFQISFESDSDGSWQILKGATLIKSGGMFADTTYQIDITAADLADEPGSHALKFVMTDVAGNVSPATDFSVTVDNSPPNLLTSSFTAKIEPEYNRYEFKWSTAGFAATDSLILVKQTNSTTAPTSIVANEVVVDGLDRNTSSHTASGSQTDQFPVSFALFACDEFGNCSRSTIIADVKFEYFNNHSNGSTAGIKAKNELAGTGPIRLATAAVKADLDPWFGSTAVGNINVATEGDSNCIMPQSTGCNRSYAAIDPWEKRYLKASLASSDGKAFLLSETITFAKVPDGMVYIDRGDWPAENGLGYAEHEGGSYAIDIYEASLASGSLDCIDYPCADDGKLVSTPSGEPAYTLNFFEAKQGCKNRTADYPEFVGASENRSIRLATGVEWVVGAYGTPDQGGVGYCNIDSRGDYTANLVISNSTGPQDTNLCTSYFGVRNAIGNIRELTDELLHDSAWYRYYGAADSNEAELLPMPIISSGANVHPVRNWDRKTAVPTHGYRSGPWSGTGDVSSKWWQTIDDRPTQVRKIAVARGGESTFSDSTWAGRFYLRFIAANINDSGARCAISAPQPSIEVSNFSEGDKARIGWKITGDVSYTNILLTKTPTLAAAARGSSPSDDELVFSHYTKCTDTAFNSVDFESTVAPTSPTDYLGTQGRCGIDISALDPWEIRYLRIFAVSPTLGRYSELFIIAKVPDGMVFVHADDWPNTTMHTAAAEIGESYSSPFNFAIDKYESSNNGTVTDCSDEAFPCTTMGSGFLESAATQPRITINWYTAKTGCDARTASLVAEDPAWATSSTDRSSTVGQQRRVHLATGLEWQVASFETPEAAGPGYCLISHDFANTASPYNQGATGNTSQQLCKSRYGVQNMIGNAHEWTDDLFDNNGVAGSGVAKNFWATSYTSGIDIGLPGTWGPQTSNGHIESYFFDKGFPETTTANEDISFSGGDYFHYSGSALSSAGERGLAAIRGGFLWHDKAAGRFWTQMHTPASGAYGVTARCALRAP